MVRGRRSAKREAAVQRQHEQQEHDAAVARARSRLTKKWGDERRALGRLGTLSIELERLHMQERNLLRERDDLVQTLRMTGNSWASLSARTKLSRQALMKRVQSIVDGGA